MPKFDYRKIDNVQKDVLQEVGNIGAGHAATALSQMIQGKINMEIPTARLIRIENISDIVGGPDVIVTGILITLQGEVEGMMMFIMDEASTEQLIELILKSYNMIATDDKELRDSTIKESGNIIAGSYLNALSHLLNKRIEPSIPYLSVDMAGAILSVPAIEFGKVSDDALIIETKFWKDQNGVTGYFILIPTLESYDKILTTLGL
ncbi:MAG: chemotaxis protein CheC [Clostridiales bacterium]|nr:chemotaxis protein CheC [Clostridiales bacterium]